MCSMGPDKKRVKKKTRKRRLDKASEMEGQRPRKLYAKPNRTQLACFHCWKSKTKCDENRPCRRCSKKGIVACFDRPPNPQAFRAELKRRQEMNKLKRSQHSHPTAKPISMTPTSSSVSYAQSSCPNGLFPSRVSQPTSQCNQRMNMAIQTNSYPLCGQTVPVPATCDCDHPASVNSTECTGGINQPIGNYLSPNLSFAGSVATRESAPTTSLPLSFPPQLNSFQHPSSSYDWMSHGVSQTPSQPGVTLKEENESILADLPPAVAVDAEQVVSYSSSSQLCSNSFTQPDTYPWPTYYHQQFNDVQTKMEPGLTETQQSVHVQQKFMFSSSVGNGGSPSELNPHFSSYSSQSCGPFCYNGGGCSSSCPFQFPQPSCYNDPQFARMTNPVSTPGSFDQYPVTPLASSQQSYNMIPHQLQTPSQQPFGSMHSEVQTIQRFPIFPGDEGNGVSAVRV